MTSHIGIVACSAEGAALCYRTVCLEAQALMGEDDHPEVTLSSISLARYMRAIRAGDWEAVAALMLESASKVEGAGATFAICPDNTIHEALPLVIPRSKIPWLHIAEVVADEAERRGFRALGILGTRYLMEGPVYKAVLDRRGISSRTPGARERLEIDGAIFTELVKGVFREETRAMFNRRIAEFQSLGCDAAVLGCTEIPLIVGDGTASLPTLDSTRLLARAAIKRALAG